MSGYGIDPYYGQMQMPLQQAGWDPTGMMNPYGGGLEYAMMPPVGAVPVAVNQPAVVPVAYNRDTSFGDALKVGLGFLAIGGLLALIFKHPPDVPWKNVFSKRFDDDQRVLTAKWMQGLQGPNGKIKQSNLSMRMKAEGGTGFVQQSINYLKDDYGGSWWKRLRNANALDAKSEQAIDVMLLHRELLRDPKDKLYKKNFYKDYGFKTHGEAVHQTQSVLRALIESYRQSGKNHNEKVQTLTNISEHFLEMYIERHKANSSNYPMGEGMALLSRLVHLPKIKHLPKTGWFKPDGRELEGERALRQFLYIASNQKHHYPGDTAANPTRLFKPDEWKSFMLQYKQLMGHKLQNNHENNIMLKALQDLAEQGSEALNQQGTDKKQNIIRQKLTCALDNLIRVTGNPSPTYNTADILKEIQGQAAPKEKGQTFALLHELLLEHHPQMDHLNTVA